MKIHLITNCTNSKSSKIKHNIKLENIDSVECFPSQVWMNTLSMQQGLCPAIDLYVGDHWARVVDVYNQNFPVWIISAGYGLISADENICSYNATFTPNDANSVSRFYSGDSLAEKNITWWKNIHSAKAVGSGDLAPIEKLYVENKSDVFFIALPPNYLKVIEPEIIKLIQGGLITKNNTFIFSTKQNLDSSLESLFYQAKDDLCEQLGGSRISLNIRLASYILKKISLKKSTVHQVKHFYSELLMNSKPAIRFDRVKMTDEKIICFIRDESILLGYENASASRLLRILRDKGMACEQTRFRALFKSTIPNLQISMGSN